MERLSVEHQNLFQRLWSEVKYLCRIATAGSKEARQLEKVKKAFEDAYRNTKPAEKNTDTNSDGVRYALKKYSKHQIENWSNNKNIVIYESREQLLAFIKDAEKKKNLSQKMYFGAVPKSLSVLIKSKTGIDVENYNCTLRASEIRKIFDDHGNEEKEAKRGQQAITPDDFALIPDIVQSPDDIISSDELYKGKPVITFKKEIGAKKQ